MSDTAPTHSNAQYAIQRGAIAARWLEQTSSTSVSTVALRLGANEGNAMIEIPCVVHQVSLKQIASDLHGLLRGVKGVEAVLGDATPDGFSILVIVNNIPYAERDPIYAAESQLAQSLPSAPIDFRIIDRRDRSLCDVVTPQAADVFMPA